MEKKCKIEIGAVDRAFSQESIRLAGESVKNGGGPFAAIIVKDGEVIAKCANSVTRDNDPTAHAEVKAIREACQKLNTYILKGCDIYASCEPCPMCLSAIYWAHIDRVFYGSTRKDAANIGFDDDFIYDEFGKAVEDRTLPCIPVLMDEAHDTYRLWMEKADKKEY